jgi:hypothetical protein
MSGIGQGKLASLIRQRLARFFELFPIRRVLQRFIVLSQCLLDLPLLYQYISLCLQRIGPVWSPLICSRELRYCSRKIAVFGKRYAPGEITRREVRSKRHGFDVRFLGTRPIAATIENVATESIAVQKCARCL